ncbi:MAG: hypothetical protein K9M57_10300, partial [Phycisphaerae bacterium]|nr:hypothetical protein [Phycisphaerae bacterium]
GEVGLIDVYNSLKPYPEGVAIKALRIVQLLPKTTPLANQPRVGFGDQKSARAILGTVPVEADGSAYFKLPVNIPVYFQAIDGDGLAVQSMRSATYVHPGEKLVCNGCHEKRHGAPLIPDHYPTAMKRQPSEITPEVAGARPFSYPLLVQPVLNRKCVPCHQKQKKAPDLRMGDLAKNPNHFYTSYRSLRPHAFFFDNAVYTTPRTIPGQFGARASKLYQMLSKGHHDVTLSKDEMHRITLWLDSNSDFFGSYENIDAQAKGEVVAPTMQ